MSGPAVFIVVEVRAVHDPAELSAYQIAAREQMLQRGGVVIARGGSSFEGEPVGRLLIQRWPSETAFREWQASDDYRPLRERRMRAADLRIAIVAAT